VASWSTISNLNFQRRLCELKEAPSRPKREYECRDANGPGPLHRPLLPPAPGEAAVRDGPDAAVFGQSRGCRLAEGNHVAQTSSHAWFAPASPPAIASQTKAGPFPDPPSPQSYSDDDTRSFRELNFARKGGPY
jgi:hypothetical protein